ncbi:hypothetical protein ACFL1U_01380 [Patescibacteria group bacterium]
MLKNDLQHTTIKDIGAGLKKELASIAKQKVPAFAQYEADLEGIKESVKTCCNARNIIVVGRGGSITSYKAIYEALGWHQSKHKVFICNTSDPNYLEHLMRFAPADNSVVVTISKSGTNVEQLENTLFFSRHKYKIAAITGPNGALREIADRLKWKTFMHPDIGGRFIGGTEAALLPTALLEIDIDKLHAGFKSMHAKCAPSVPLEKNPALQVAAAFYQLEKKGFSEIFFPIYSHELAGISELIVQLFHESVSKEGGGQTMYGAEGPQSQHHTNQRFFGGGKNVVGWFIRPETFFHDHATYIPEEIGDIPLRDGTLADLDDIPLSKVMEYEYRGTYEDAINIGIPVITTSITKLDEENVGELMGFLQYAAVYSGWMRGVNPFDQPQVEASKNISFDLRKKKA